MDNPIAVYICLYIYICLCVYMYTGTCLYFGDLCVQEHSSVKSELNVDL